MDKKKYVVIIIAAVLALIVLLPISSYNSLARSRERVYEKEAVIDVQLKRRADLIGNLVESVKGYAEHEAEVIKSVSDARLRLSGAVTAQDKAAANEDADSALGRLIAITESYPELKASSNFIQLSDELAGTENRISVARIDYNAAVSDYNKRIATFPGSIFASIGGFERLSYFEAAPGDTQPPVVNFGK